MQIDHLTMKPAAVDYLARALRQGELAPMLGSGVSIGEGLPDWVTLLQRVLVRAGQSPDKVSSTSSADDLQLAADDVRRDFCKSDEKAFASLITACLYENVKLSSQLLRSDWLIALGLLLMGSRRGSVNRVVTFNFDSILEWYLTLAGFVPRVVLRPPELEGTEDVRIYHPNGFLPHPDQGLEESGFVMLGSEAINRRIGTAGEPWYELLRHQMRTSVCLFVGLSVRSFRDRELAPLLAVVGKELDDKRPTGFWLITEDVDDSAIKQILATNVVPIVLQGYHDVPSFLVSVCQEAAAHVVL